MRIERVALVGAGGPTGIHLARALLARGRTVRALARRRERLERLFHGTGAEVVAVDALDAEALRRAVDGSDLVVDCVGLPAQEMHLHPAVAHAVASAAGAAGARILQVSSYWSFFPQVRERIDESHPRAGGHAWFRHRREAEDVLLAAGAAVAHVPDFYGPEVHSAVVQSALDDAVAGRPIAWMGGRRMEREAAFVPDAMRIVADLLEREAAYGNDWALPGNGRVSADLLARVASRRLGRRVRVRAMPGWLLAGLAPLLPPLRAFRPLIPQYARPVAYDTTRLRALLGPVRTTPLEESLEATLDWLAAGNRVEP